MYWIERNTTGWWGKNKNGISEYQTYDILMSLKISLFMFFTGVFLTAVIYVSTMLIPVLCLPYICMLLFLHRNLKSSIIENYEEYYVEFEKDSFNKKILWAIFSYIVYMFSKIAIILSIIVFLWLVCRK